MSTKLIVQCTECKQVIHTSYTGPLLHEYQIPCPGCNITFKYNPKTINIQCRLCDHIGEYVQDDREFIYCSGCKEAFTGFLTRNKNSLIKAIQDCFSSFPPEYEEIGKVGEKFIGLFLSHSTDLADIDLKTSLAEFQKGIYWMMKHLQEKGDSNGTGEESTGGD